MVGIPATQVFNLIGKLDPLTQTPPASDSNQIHLMGRPICLKGLAQLLGVGSPRIARLKSGFSNTDDPQCPMDGRLRRAGCAMRSDTAEQTAKRELVHEFLMELYVRHSEPMPEVVADHGGRAQTSKPLKFRRLKGKRPRNFKKRDEKLTEVQAQELRLLPPGHYTDWLRLFHAKHEHCKVSLKLFTRVAQTKFHWTSLSLFSVFHRFHLPNMLSKKWLTCSLKPPSAPQRSGMRTKRKLLEIGFVVIGRCVVALLGFQIAWTALSFGSCILSLNHSGFIIAIHSLLLKNFVFDSYQDYYYPRY